MGIISVVSSLLGSRTRLDRASSLIAPVPQPAAGPVYGQSSAYSVVRPRLSCFWPGADVSVRVTLLAPRRDDESRLNVYAAVQAPGDPFPYYVQPGRRLTRLSPDADLAITSRPWLSDWDGRLLHDASLFSVTSCPDVPHGAYTVYVVVVPNGLSPLGTDNHVSLSSCVFRFEDTKTALSLLATEVTDVRSQLTQATGDPALVLNDTNSVVVTSRQIRDTLLGTYSAYPGLKSEKVFLSDRAYRAPYRRVVEYVLRVNGVRHHPYAAEAHDCDDFSYELMGYLSNPLLSDGTWCVVWGRRLNGSLSHALNGVVLTEDGTNLTFMLVEPQSGTLLSPHQYDLPGSSGVWTPFLVVC